MCTSPGCRNCVYLKWWYSRLATVCDMFRQGTDPQLRPDRAGAQLRMCQPEVVVAFSDVVRELVAEREAEAERLAVRTDGVEADDFRFLTAVLGEGGHGKLATRPHQ